MNSIDPQPTRHRWRPERVDNFSCGHFCWLLCHLEPVSLLAWTAPADQTTSLECGSRGSSLVIPQAVQPSLHSLDKASRIFDPWLA